MTNARSEPRVQIIMTLVYIIRHGETEWNLKGIHQGHKNSDLTQKGKEQADRLGQRFKESNLAFNSIYSSDLGRSLDTAHRICEPIGQKEQIIKIECLRERALGVLEGLTYDEIKEKLPKDYLEHTSGNPNYKPEGGESWKDTHDRVERAFNEIVKNHENEQILCVTHGGIVSMMLRLCLNIPLTQKRKFGIPNTGINIFEHRLDEGWRLRTWGDISHFKSSEVLDEML